MVFARISIGPFQVDKVSYRQSAVKLCYKHYLDYGVKQLIITYLQPPLRHWGAGNVYILVLSKLLPER